MNSNLYIILKKLNKQEFKKFGEFVRSPFFNKNPEIIKLYDYISNLYPDFNNSMLENRKILRQILKKKNYNENALKGLQYKLSKLAVEFMAMLDYKQDYYSPERQLLNALEIRGLDNLFKKYLKAYFNKTASLKIKDADFYYNNYIISKLEHNIYSKTYTALTIKDKPGKEILNLSENLLIFFFISILQRYRYLLNKKHTVKTEMDLPFLDEVINYLSNNGSNFLNLPYINILYKQILLLRDDEENYELFEELKKKLINNVIIVDSEEQRNSLTVLINYCIEMIYRGKGEYNTFMFDIEKYLLSAGLYKRVKRAYFETTHFDNMITLAVNADDFDWALKFIHDYKNELHPDSRNNTCNMSYAKLYFKKHEYLKALDYLNKVAYSDINYKLSVRVLTIKIHYELDNMDEAFNMLEAFRKFVSHDSLISKQHETISINFIKFTRELIRIKQTGSLPDTIRIKDKVMNCKSIMHRAWLLEKIKELEKS